MVTLSCSCLRPDSHEIWRVGWSLNQRGWKISKLWLPWQPLPWQPKNLLRAHKTPKRLWNSNRMGIRWEEICCHGFISPWQPLCCHGNQKCTIAGQCGRKSVVKDVTMSLLVAWVTFGGTVTSHWPLVTSWYKKLTSEYQETSPRSPMAPQWPLERIQFRVSICPRSDNGIQQAGVSWIVMTIQPIFKYQNYKTEVSVMTK